MSKYLNETGQNLRFSETAVSAVNIQKFVQNSLHIEIQ